MIILFLYLPIQIEAIHNKDYSVVKTFKAVLKTDRFFIISKSKIIIKKWKKSSSFQLFLLFDISVTN